MRKPRSAGIFERLQVVVDAGLAVVVAGLHALEEQLDLLVRDDVADVLGIRQVAEGEADHLVVGDRRAAAVAGVDGGIDLDAQARGRVAVGDELDARDDALGDREGGAPGRIAVREHRVLDLRQGARARQRRAAFEERLVIELEDGQVDARGEGLDGGGDLVARLVPLHLHLAGVGDHVRVGEDALALDDDARAARLDGSILAQGRDTSGRRMVENTLTTAVSASWLMALLAAAAAGFGSAASTGVAKNCGEADEEGGTKFVHAETLTLGAAAVILTHRPGIHVRGQARVRAALVRGRSPEGEPRRLI